MMSMMHSCSLLTIRPPPISTLFPYTTLFRSLDVSKIGAMGHSQGSSATSTAAGDSRVQDAILFNGGNNAAKPYLAVRSEEHTSELQSRRDLVCRLLLEKKKYEKLAFTSTFTV